MVRIAVNFAAAALLQLLCFSAAGLMADASDGDSPCFASTTKSKCKEQNIVNLKADVPGCKWLTKKAWRKNMACRAKKKNNAGHMSLCKPKKKGDCVAQKQCIWAPTGLRCVEKKTQAPAAPTPKPTQRPTPQPVQPTMEPTPEPRHSLDTLPRPDEVRSADGRLCLDLYVDEVEALPIRAYGKDGAGKAKVTFNTQLYALDMDAFQTEGATAKATLVGPVIRIRAGDNLHVALHNHLDKGRGNCGKSGHNTLQCAAVTNLHLHGLAIHGEGVGDNVLRRAHPGETLDYRYEIPCDHAPGTFVYHAHVHGSTAYQVTGGLAGVLIVEDDPDADGYDARLGDMKEHVMAMSSIFLENEDKNGEAVRLDCGNGNPDSFFPLCMGRTFKSYKALHAATSGASAPHAPDTQWLDEDWEMYNSQFYVTNGAYNPAVVMEPNELRRFRLANLSPIYYMPFKVKGCSMHLLALDGVYLKKVSQRNVIYLPPFGRADVAIRCTKKGTFQASADPEHLSKEMRAAVAEENQNFEDGAMLKSALFRIVVQGKKVKMSLPATLPAWPAYLQDLTTAETVVQEGRKGSIDFKSRAGINGRLFPHETEQVCLTRTSCIDDSECNGGVCEGGVCVAGKDVWDVVNNCKVPVTANNTVHVGARFVQGAALPPPVDPSSILPDTFYETEGFMAVLEAGTVQEWEFSEVQHDKQHPFHLHTTHVMVSSCGPFASSKGKNAKGQCLDFARVGEWRDVLPTTRGMAFRFSAKVLGAAVVHCHWLQHEDEGMMATVDIRARPPGAPAEEKPSQWPRVKAEWALALNPDSLCSLSAPAARAERNVRCGVETSAPPSPTPVSVNCGAKKKNKNCKKFPEACVWNTNSKKCVDIGPGGSP